ncbi:cytochrome c [Rhizobium sp. ARZ01]|uniref:c-type cytochrome n=1 Tax=Rhizobium sp. ARZ01 TaxID=2769313 RepID=UPI001780CA47|nr:cytochrome c [Rhizobium sp. ARZ01]MBD9373596.1 cytochrome c [Rhizobium sp. ARZ01]
MRTLILAIAALALTGSAAFADPIADRKALMKERGKLAGTLAPMVKGEMPFDAAVAMAALNGLNANAQRFDVDVLFPAGSETGDTAALPTIWQDMPAFKAAAEKFQVDVAAAVAANPQDLDALKVQFNAVTTNCGACHEKFRMKKQ